MGDFPHDRFPSPPPPPPPPIPALQAYHVLFSEPAESLPEPLPTPEDIENSPNVIIELSVRCTKIVGEHYIAKYGAEIEPLEAENMMFVRKQSPVRVPQVYAVYQRAISERTKITYIIMERILGTTLQNIWPGLEALDKLNIATQLRVAFNNLRGIPHEGYFGSLDRSKLRDGIFWMAEPFPVIDRPFETEDELLHGLMERYLHDSGERAQHIIEYYRRVLPSILRGDDKPVFTHNDLQLKNVMITPEGTVVLLDWATSGWYPSYWEYAATMYAGRGWKDDWHVYVAEILEEFPSHFIWMQTLRIEMWA